VESIPIWVSLVGAGVSLVTVAGSAVAYVVKLYLDRSERRRQAFFELMKMIDSPAPIAQKVAAVYRLREFPEDRDFIVRFCKTQRDNIKGPATEPLQIEMDATRQFFES
jgi:hypothetical protein